MTDINLNIHRDHLASSLNLIDQIEDLSNLISGKLSAEESNIFYLDLISVLSSSIYTYRPFKYGCLGRCYELMRQLNDKSIDLVEYTEMMSDMSRCEDETRHTAKWLLGLLEYHRKRLHIYLKNMNEFISVYKDLSSSLDENDTKLFNSTIEVIFYGSPYGEPMEYRILKYHIPFLHLFKKGSISLERFIYITQAIGHRRGVVIIKSNIKPDVIVKVTTVNWIYLNEEEYIDTIIRIISEFEYEKKLQYVTPACHTLDFFVTTCLKETNITLCDYFFNNDIWVKDRFILYKESIKPMIIATGLFSILYGQGELI
jgi:hypothetical protein